MDSHNHVRSDTVQKINKAPNPGIRASGAVFRVWPSILPWSPDGLKLISVSQSVTQDSLIQNQALARNFYFWRFRICWSRVLVWRDLIFNKFPGEFFFFFPPPGEFLSKGRGHTLSHPTCPQLPPHLVRIPGHSYIISLTHVPSTHHLLFPLGYPCLTSHQPWLISRAAPAPMELEETQHHAPRSLTHIHRHNRGHRTTLYPFSSLLPWSFHTLIFLDQWRSIT